MGESVQINPYQYGFGGVPCLVVVFCLSCKKCSTVGGSSSSGEA